MDTTKFKTRLEEEKLKLERELGELGVRNSNNPADFDAVKQEGDVDTGDEGEVAEAENEYSTNRALVDSLEKRYQEVLVALSKIDNGQYGVCEVCGGQIEEVVLEANPASLHCKSHIG